MLEDSKRTALTATVIDISIGILLYTIAEFGIQLYNETRLDFWDHGKITKEGILYLFMQLGGAVIGASGFVLTGTIWVKDITSALKGKNETVTEEKASQIKRRIIDRSQEWICGFCDYKNRAGAAYCEKCGCDRNAATGGEGADQ